MKSIIGVSLISLVLGWAATGTIPPAPITPDEATLKYFPQETQGIVFIDVAALRNAPLVQDVLNKGQFRSLPQGLNDFEQSTGFDIRRDLDRVTIGKISAREKLVVADARYDKFKMEQFVKDKGKEVETYLGRAIYRDGDAATTFLDNVIFFGTENTVKGAIDRMTYPGSPQIGRDLLDAIGTIETGNQVWAVGNLSEEDLPAAKLHESTPAAQILKSLRRGTYQMKVDSDLHARATGNFSDADTAGNLADMARGFIAVLKLQVAKQQPDLLRLLDGIQVSSNGSAVMVRIEEPGDLLIKLQESRPKLGRNLQ
jgi:hypothetical protein